MCVHVCVVCARMCVRACVCVCVCVCAHACTHVCDLYMAAYSIKSLRLEFHMKQTSQIVIHLPSCLNITSCHFTIIFKVSSCVNVSLASNASKIGT